MTYVIAAYTFAVVILGGYLALSLNHLRELTRNNTRER